MPRYGSVLLCLVGSLLPATLLAQHTSKVREPPGAGAMADAAMSANAQMSDDPFMSRGHVEMSPSRPRTNADSVRAVTVLRALRESLERYRDVAAARRDGYQIFAPEVPGQRVYHFNNYAYAMANDANFDETHPTSLLYRKRPDGGFVLDGAMFTAPADLPLDSLDRRVPLSVAHWHRHVNFCLPPAGKRHAGNVTDPDGTPIFGPRGVTTRAACDAAGGRFVPQLFGWMVHVSPFVSEDPYVAFGNAMHHME